MTLRIERVGDGAWRRSAARRPRPAGFPAAPASPPPASPMPRGERQVGRASNCTATSVTRLAEPLAGADVERRPRPPPVVDLELGRDNVGVALSDGAQRARRQRDADVHRGRARDRQLAVGGDAVLHPHRQAARQAGHRGGGATQAPAPPAVLPRGIGALGGELAGAADPAGRGHLAALRRQGAVADPRDPHA